MADFVKVAKEYTRMCSNSDNCGECPIQKLRDKTYVCRYWILVVDPEKAEEAIMQWAKEHPVKTNAKKFAETFGINPLLMDWWNTRGADWLMEEYKEPEK